MPTKTTTTTMSQTSPSGTESLALILYRLDELATNIRKIEAQFSDMPRMADLRRLEDSISSVQNQCRQELIEAIEERKIAVDGLDHRIRKLEAEREKVLLRVTYIAVAFLVALVLAMYGLDKYIKL